MKTLLLALPLCVMACTQAQGTIGDVDRDDPTAPSPKPTPGGDSGSIDPEDTGSLDTGPIQEAAPPPPSVELAKELDLTEVAMFQGVKVPLEKAGAAYSEGKVHVIAGREGLLRVYVKPKSSFTAREITAELTLDGKVLTQTKTVSGASEDAKLDSTINIDIAAGVLKTGMKWKLRLLEKPGPTGETGTAEFPETPLEVVDTGDSLKLVLVPMKVNGYSPDVSEAQLKRYRDELQAMYPVRKIDLQVHAEVAYSGVGARGVGIDGALDAITTLRKTDGADSDVYYYGVFAPTSSWSTYCVGSCTTGLCHLPGVNDSYLRACVGIGFTGSQSPETMAHELGHAHGIPHSPCGGVAGADAKYPYSGGKLGSWGYDERTQSMVSPTASYDFMSYCSPEWISDYAYNRITERMSAVNKLPAMIGGALQSYQFVHVKEDGSLEWGSDIELDEPMLGEPHAITAKNPDGTVRTITGYYHPRGDGGGTLLVPKARGQKLGSLTVGGFGVERHLF